MEKACATAIASAQAFLCCFVYKKAVVSLYGGNSLVGSLLLSSFVYRIGSTGITI